MPRYRQGQNCDLGEIVLSLLIAEVLYSVNLKCKYLVSVGALALSHYTADGMKNDMWIRMSALRAQPFHRFAELKRLL